MLKRAVFTGIALILGGFLAAEAGFRVWNLSSQRIDVAFRYPHSEFGRTSEGWWTFQPGLHGGKLDCGEHKLQGRHFLVVDTEGASNHIHNLRD